MRIAIGSDHAGFRCKTMLHEMLVADGHDVVDHGTFSEESVDYPIFAAAVARAVAGGEAERGVLVCGSGNGVAIAANKLDGIRAAVAHDVTSARLAAEHNDANVVCIGARFVGEQTATDSVQAFVAALFQGGRHQRRVDEIARLEQEQG